MKSYTLYGIAFLILPFAIYLCIKFLRWLLDYLMSKVDTEFERYLIIIGYVVILIIGIILLD